MKNLVIAALATLVVSSSALAYNPKEATVPTAGTLAKLVPLEIVHPQRLPRTFARQTFTLEFTLDASGRPQQIEVISKTDRATREAVISAFKQWKFDARAMTVGQRYVLPLEVVAPEA